MLDVSIQVVNYKTKKYLKSCLEDVLEDLKNSPLSFEINVLDNASGDDLSDLEKRFKEAPVKFYYSDKNGGFGFGHNFLAKKARVRYLLLLNPDLKFIEKDTIKRLIETLEKTGADVVGPGLLNREGKIQLHDHGELYGLRTKIALGAGGSYWKERQTITESAWVSGAVFLIKKAMFDKLGGFDENFFLYKEEEDLCLRLRAMGGKVIYDPGIKVMHWGSVVANKKDAMPASLKYFYSKHHSGLKKRLKRRSFRMIEASLLKLGK